MKKNLEFKAGNRGLLLEELGLVDSLNATLQASAEKHAMRLKPGCLIAIRFVKMPGGAVLRRVGALDADPVMVPLACVR